MQLEFDMSGVPDPVDLVKEPGNGSGVDADGKPRPPKRLSHSGASTFEQCPRRWRFRYVDQLPDPPGRPALVGTYAHKVLELLLQESSSDRTIDKAKKISRSHWAPFSEQDDFQALELDEEQRREFRWQAWRAIEGLWALEDPVDVNVESVEEDVTTTLGRVPFRGVVDRIDREADGLVVTDYKSGKAPSVRHAPARLHQVLLYAAAVEADTGVMPVKARLYYLGQRIVDTEVTETELSATVEKLTSTWAGIAEACLADVFEARPSIQCDYCPYAEHCPEGQHEIADRAAERQAREEWLMRLADA